MYDTCMNVSLMLLETDLLTLSMAEGLKLAPFINTARPGKGTVLYPGYNIMVNGYNIMVNYMFF